MRARLYHSAVCVHQDDVTARDPRTTDRLNMFCSEREFRIGYIGFKIYDRKPITCEQQLGVEQGKLMCKALIYYPGCVLGFAFCSFLCTSTPSPIHRYYFCDCDDDDDGNIPAHKTLPESQRVQVPN